VALRVILDVDTGADDAGALLLAATCPEIELLAVLATWGNCPRDQAARNTLAILEAAGRADVAVHLGGSGPVGPTPVLAGAGYVMGRDGLGDAGVADPAGRADREPAAEALVRRAAAEPGVFTLIALAPLSTVAAALVLDPGLPGRLHHLIVMGGAIAVGGNLTAAAEANIGHDPEAAARVVDAFGRPGGLASGRPPCLVPLDVTLRSPLTVAELDALEGSSTPGAGLLHQVWRAVWPTGRLETGQEGVWPAHDLLATWCLLDPGVCEWMTVPLSVDIGGSAAWGATIADRRVGRLEAWAAGGLAAQGDVATNRWDVALRVDAERYRAGIREWLAGRPAPQQ
jgi:inosine-uridine nucleoside N-ribohydrolase